MITPEKIDEWIREIEERPSSALFIVRSIANRLTHLTERNEELLAENIQLRTEKKVEEYEARIANLEYQLELLKRHLKGEIVEGEGSESAPETISLFVYNPRGMVLRLEVDPSAMAAGKTVARLKALVPESDEEETADLTPRLMAAGSHEELLFLFDSGRTMTMPAASIPVSSEAPDWSDAFQEEPRGAEELAAIVPVGRMSLMECSIQTSRRGCVKKIMRNAFESYVAKGYVGTGVKLQTDRTCGLTLCAKDDRLVLASQEGFLLTLETGPLSYGIEETVRLSPTDHIFRSFGLGQKKLVVFVTHNGKVIQREAGWLEIPESPRTRGQAVFSEERRKAGARLVGAEAVAETDWGAALDAAGSLSIYAMRDLLGAGAVPAEAGLIAFTTF